MKDACVFGPAPSTYFFNGGEPLTSQIDAPADSALYVDKNYLQSLNMPEYCRLPSEKDR